MTEQEATEEDVPPTLGERLTAAAAVPGRLLGALFLPDRHIPPEVARGRYGAALLAVTLCALLTALVVGVRLDPSLGGGPGGPPGQGQQMEQQSEREIAEQQGRDRSLMRVTSALGAGFGTPVMILIGGVGLYLVGRYVGGRPTLPRMIAAMSHAALPGAVKAIVTIIAVVGYPVLSPKQLGSITTSASLLPQGVDLPPLVAKLAAGVDVFTIWSVILAGFGFAAAAGVSRKKAFAAVVVCFALLQLLAPSPMGGR